MSATSHGWLLGWDFPGPALNIVAGANVEEHWRGNCA
jgi:hypothetical protein